MQESPSSDGPPGALSGFLGSNADLFYLELGTGHPLVVVHGGPDFNHVYLRPELDRLSNRLRVVYYDQRGRGRSWNGVLAENVSVESELADLEEVRLHSGAEAIAVIGHSWGGLLAMEYALRHPERISHLVLMDTAPASHSDWLLFRKQLSDQRSAPDTQNMESLSSTARYARGDLATEGDYYRSHFRMTLHRPDLLEELVGRLRRDFTPESVLIARAIERRLYEETWQTPRYDLTPGLRNLDIPTLIIHGTNDFIPVEIASRLADEIPGAALSVLKDRGHFAYIESPDEVCEAIASFIVSS